MSEERSLRNKGKEVARRAGARVTAATSTLSGKNIEQQIVEYSELYTQVLLGLHGDLEAQERKLSEYGTQTEALKRQVASFGVTRIFAIAAFVIAVVAAGGALWVAL